MNHATRRGAFAASAVLLAAGALTACAGGPGGGGDPAANDAAAARFVACLNAAGQTAKVLDGGQVGLLMPEIDLDGGGAGTITAPEGGDGPVSSMAVFMDEDGAWMASSSADGYPVDGGMREAWTDCEAEVPEFEQPTPDMSGTGLTPVSRVDMLESSLAFAECARDEGYADFPDPDADGMVDFPSGMTEDGFRALLEACLPDDGMSFLPVSPDSAASFDFDWLAIMGEFGGASGVAIPAEPQQ